MKFLIRALAALCSCLLAAPPSAATGAEPPKNAVVFGVAALDEVALIGLPKADAIQRLGEPEGVLGPEEGYQTFEYSTRHQLSVVFKEGKLVQYILGSDSKARTTKGVQLGSHVGVVTGKYGDFTREEAVAEWFGGTAARVLYHHPEYDKYKLIYPDADLIYIFNAKREVELIWVGFPAP